MLIQLIFVMLKDVADNGPGINGRSNYQCSKVFINNN